jgi:anti-sigma factor RsiW
MPDCSRIDSLVTPFVDGALPPAAQQDVSSHLGTCSSCRAKVVAERSVRALLQARRPELTAGAAPADLKDRLAALRTQRPAATVHPFPAPAPPPVVVPVAAARASWSARLRPFALAASLVLLVGGAFLYQATRSSSRVLAAELAADHMKCFGLNNMIGTSHSHDEVEASMASLFDWTMEVPHVPADENLELVGSRFCLYGEGKTAHIMFKHAGQPMSLFMLPSETRSDELVRAFGHQLRMWSVGDRTFVLVSQEPAQEVERMASLVRASLK